MPVWFTQCGLTGHRITASFGREMSLSQHHMANDNIESCHDASMCLLFLTQTKNSSRSFKALLIYEWEDPYGNGAGGGLKSLQGLSHGLQKVRKEMPRKRGPIYTYRCSVIPQNSTRTHLYEPRKTSPQMLQSFGNNSRAEDFHVFFNARTQTNRDRID